MRVIIDAAQQTNDGGILQVLIGLAYGFQKLNTTDEFIFVTDSSNPNWLDPYVGGNVRVIKRAAPTKSLRERVKEQLGPLEEPALRIWRAYRQAKQIDFKTAATVPHSDGFLESLQGDLLHLPYPPRYALTTCPVVISLFDLQHRHYPAYFSQTVMTFREAVYPAMFSQASQIAVPTEWVSEDMVKQYQVPREKMRVIALASALSFEGAVSPEIAKSTKARYGLPDSFYYFPAATYEHKNHIALLEAIDLLNRREGLRVNLICTGGKITFWPNIERRLKELKLDNQVKFLGNVSQIEIKTLFKLCKAMITPTLFEGGTLPILEALDQKVPMLCSQIPPNREYAKVAAVYFDPNSPSDIADKIAKFEKAPIDSAARAEVERVNALYDWTKTAAAYYEMYLSAMGANSALRTKGRR